MYWPRLFFVLNSLTVSWLLHWDSLFWIPSPLHVVYLLSPSPHVISMKLCYIVRFQYTILLKYILIKLFLERTWRRGLQSIPLVQDPDYKYFLALPVHTIPVTTTDLCHYSTEAKTNGCEQIWHQYAKFGLGWLIPVLTDGSFPREIGFVKTEVGIERMPWHWRHSRKIPNICTCYPHGM